jgi:meiosis-specific protein
LKCLILAVFSDDKLPNHVYETYTFDFSYTQDDNPNFSLALSGGSKVDALELPGPRSMQQVVRRTIYITQNLDPLPEDCWLTVKLLYDEERTPLEYSPPGFRDARDDEVFYFMADDRVVCLLRIH